MTKPKPVRKFLDQCFPPKKQPDESRWLKRITGSILTLIFFPEFIVYNMLAIIAVIFFCGLAGGLFFERIGFNIKWLFEIYMNLPNQR